MLHAHSAHTIRAPHSTSQGKFNDELLVSIAEVLGSFAEYVGSTEAHCLFQPLEALCSVEESAVREQAVASINQLGKTLSRAQLQAHLVPLVLRLAEQMDWFTPRVSACGLCALAFSACERGSMEADQQIRRAAREVHRNGRKGAKGQAPA